MKAFTAMISKAGFQYSHASTSERITSTKELIFHYTVHGHEGRPNASTHVSSKERSTFSHFFGLTLFLMVMWKQTTVTVLAQRLVSL